MYVKDLTGQEYALRSIYTQDLELNGNQSISMSIESNKVNNLFIDDVTEMWTAFVENVGYRLTYVKKQGSGDELTVDVKGVPLFFDDFNTDRIYETYNGSMTAEVAFNQVFSDTPYTYVINDTFYAVEWQGFGDGETRLETFKRCLNRYGAEFKIVGNVIHLYKLIGRDTSFMYRYRLNASNIVKEVDATDLWTYIKGFGDFKEGEQADALLKREYMSPLATVLGKRHAPPVYNGNIKDKSTMDETIKKVVDDSLKISVSANIHDLRKQGYNLAQPELGDRTFLIDERIKLNEEVRIINIVTVKDWQGNVLDLNLTFGSESIVKRHQSNLQTAIDRINDLIGGKTKLPSSALEDAILIATNALRSAQTELLFSDNGIAAVDKDDPNLVVLLNSRGVGVSDDGGFTFRTAMTGEGINADLIVVGTMLFDRIKGGTLTLGGMDNVNGIMQVFNSDGELIADLDGDRGGFESLQIGDVISDSVVKVNTLSYDLYVDPASGSDENDGLTEETALETVQRAIDSIPKFNQGIITIRVLNKGVVGMLVRESVILYGFMGNGEITVDFGTTKTILEGWVTVTGCVNRVEVANVTIRGRSQTSGARAWSSSRVFFRNLIIYGNGIFHTGIYCTASSIEVLNCEIYELVGDEFCIRGAGTGAIIYINDCKGIGRYGLRGTGSAQFAGYGTQPQGTVAKQLLTGGSFTHASLTEDPPHEAPLPVKPTLPPKETTGNWTQSSSNTWQANSGGQWANQYNKFGTDVIQGKWSNAGPQRGLWFFGNAVRNTVNGKSIKRIRVRITRKSSGGYSSAVSAVIRPHAYASKPTSTSAPSFLGASHAVKFKWGETKWVTLPSSFHSFFANGSAYGLGLYTTSVSNTDYMRFTGNAEIEITYN